MNNFKRFFSYRLNNTRNSIPRRKSIPQPSIPTIPSGIPSILNHPSIVIGRQLEMMNLLIGYEQANKYAIKLESGLDVGFIAEHDQSIVNTVMRNILHTRRSFNADILDRTGALVLKIKRPIKWFLNSQISVYTADDVLLGHVDQVWHLWRRQYDLFIDKNGVSKQFGKMDAGFLAWDFNLHDKNDAVLGAVNRNFGGFAREIFTDTGTYAVHMDQLQGQRGNLSINERAVLLACAINIDIDYFSRTSGRGGMFPFMMFGGGSEDLASSPEPNMVTVNNEKFGDSNDTLLHGGSDQNDGISSDDASVDSDDAFLPNLDYNDSMDDAWVDSNDTWFDNFSDD